MTSLQYICVYGYPSECFDNFLNYVHNTKTKITHFPISPTIRELKENKSVWKVSIWLHSTLPSYNWINRVLKSRRQTCFLILLTGQSKHIFCFCFFLRWVACREWKKGCELNHRCSNTGWADMCSDKDRPLLSKIPVRLALLKFIHCKLSHRKIIPSPQQMAIIVIAYWAPTIFQGQWKTHERLQLMCHL